jgi:catechol 2,3-dioxygenase-like lactoylglutathione lyase family enzyme
MTDPMPPLRTSHVGLYVHDVAKMLEFYTSVMGLTETDRGIVRGGDTEFYISQPCPEPLDLALPAAEIRARSEAVCRGAPGFRPIAESRAELAMKMGRTAA